MDQISWKSGHLCFNPNPGGDLLAKKYMKPPIFFPLFLYISGGMEGLFDFYTLSTITPGLPIVSAPSSSRAALTVSSSF